MSNAISNMPEPVTVSELSHKLKRSIEQQFDFVRVRGELSKVKIYGSGHLYTDLKDENSVINAVCWKGVLNTLSIRPEEGMEVICTGKLTTYPARSNYQLVIESMELAGEGAQLKQLEQLKKKLAAEGLFDPSRKKPLPYLPKRLGIITSPSGAVIHDILHRVQDRFPLHVMLWPATVQGVNTVREVIAGIEAFNAMPVDQRPDVLIVARGGGSLEDLMPFNDEAIVRAVAASQIPVISAVGHETDTTLIDFASDHRAPTPTAAAERAVPVLADLLYTVGNQQQRLLNFIGNRLKHDRNDVRHLQTRLGDPVKILDMQAQKLDYLGLQAQQGLKNLLNKLQQVFTKTQTRLLHPQVQLTHMADRLQSVTQRLDPAFTRHLDKTGQQLRHAGSLLESFSFKKTLERGFAVVTNDNDQVITSAAQARQQSKLKLVFADGLAKAIPEKS